MPRALETYAPQALRIVVKLHYLTIADTCDTRFRVNHGTENVLPHLRFEHYVAHPAGAQSIHTTIVHAERVYKLAQMPPRRL